MTARAALSLLAMMLMGCSEGSDPLQPQGNPVPENATARLKYDAETVVVYDVFLTVLTRVTVTNVGDETELIEGGGCAVLLRAYSSSARSGPPVWLHADEAGFCPTVLQEQLLAPGESMQLRPASASAGQILGMSNPPGRYFFTAVVTLEDRPVVEISAGDAELR